MEYSRTLPAVGEGGGAFHPSPAICQTTWPILHPKTALAPGLNFQNMLQNFIYDVTDDVTGRVRGKILDFLSLLASPGKAGVSN